MTSGGTTSIVIVSWAIRGPGAGPRFQGIGWGSSAYLAVRPAGAEVQTCEVLAPPALRRIYERLGM